jgi:hypothetical protein
LPPNKNGAHSQGAVFIFQPFFNQFTCGQSSKTKTLPEPAKAAWCQAAFAGKGEKDEKIILIFVYAMGVPYQERT